MAERQLFLISANKSRPGHSSFESPGNPLQGPDDNQRPTGGKVVHVYLLSVVVRGKNAPCALTTIMEAMPQQMSVTDRHLALDQRKPSPRATVNAFPEEIMPWGLR